MPSGKYTRVTAATLAKNTSPPAALRRSNSFLGIHFDFHAGDDCTAIGKNVTPAMVTEIIRKVRPDYIQCDCKGHRGLSSYPTRVGNRAPGFVGDPLRIWRKITAEHGVALFMHYSGVWDTEAIKRNPAWARIDEKGARDPNNTSVFGPYVDKLLIPQLKELRDEYRVDGVWIDGECWATCQDYTPRVLAQFRKATGIRKIPRKPEDPHFFEFTEFCREAFRRYLRHYIDALHAHDPAFQIASNWAFSSFMPGPVSANVDFISGDYPLQDSLRAARLEGRCMMRQGRPWDLMAWGFCSRFGEKGASSKSALQLQQELSIVLALGGGVQVYYKQKRDGSIERWPMNVMGEVARFCRARQALSHRAEPVPQIALLNSSAAHYRISRRIFSPWNNEFIPLRGILDLLLDAQQVVEVLSEHHLAGRMDQYPLIIIPESAHLDTPFRKELPAYARRGGRLLIIGPTAARLFKQELGITLLGKPEKKARFIAHHGAMFGVNSHGCDVKLKPRTLAIADYFPVNDLDEKSRPTASIRPLGKGWIAGTYMDLGESYHKAGTSLARDFLASIVRRLFPRPVVEVTGSHRVDVSLMRKAGQLLVHLVNTSGPHADENVYTFDEIPAVGPLKISIRLPRRPRSVRLHPGNRSVKFTWSAGAIHLRLPRLEIHKIIDVE